MNTKILALCGLATVMSLGVTMGVSAQAPGAPIRPGRAARERHPEIRAALKALRNARERLQRAAHDFEGHREKALDHTDAAIKECELALASDRK